MFCLSRREEFTKGNVLRGDLLDFTKELVDETPLLPAMLGLILELFSIKLVGERILTFLWRDLVTVLFNFFNLFRLRLFNAVMSFVEIGSFKT